MTWRENDLAEEDDPLGEAMAEEVFEEASEAEEEESEQEEASHTTLFTLEVSELLREVQVRHSAAVDTFVHDVCAAVKATPSEELTIRPNSHILGSAVHFTQDFSFQFHPPRFVSAINHFPLGLLTTADPTIDVAVRIPQQCLLEKDHLNFRYLDKRNAYLAHVAASLKKSLGKRVDSIRISHLRNDPAKPILVLHPKHTATTNKKRKRKTAAHDLSHFRLRLIPCVEQESLKAKKLAANLNCVRDAASDTARVATAYYNGRVLEDMYLEQSHHLCQRFLQEHPRVKDALVLLQVWLAQRQLNTDEDGFTFTEQVALLRLLVARRAVSGSMTAYQVFRATLEWLCIADNDLSARAAAIPGEFEQDAQASCAFFGSGTRPVALLDGAACQGRVNALHRCSLYAWQRLLHEAGLSKSFMNNMSMSVFDHLFLHPMPFRSCFDAYFRIPLRQIPHATKMAPGHCHWTYSRDRVLRVLKKACQDRVQLLAVDNMSFATPELSLGDDVTVEQRLAEHVVVGVLYNPLQYDRTLDTGPPADSPEAKRFKGFWGVPAQVRRFRDASISMAVVWGAEHGIYSHTQHRVLECIVRHILLRHLSIDPSTVVTTAYQFDPLLSLGTLPSDKNVPNLPCMLGSPAELLAAFNEFKSALVNTDVPLHIKGIHTTHPALRNCAVFPPVPLPFEGIALENPGTSLDVVPVVVQFESSGKWPNDLRAMERIKTAFYLRMSHSLRQEHQVQSVVHEGHMDVFFPHGETGRGFVFRMKIHSERDLPVMQVLGTSEQKRQLQWELMDLPHHASTLQGLTNKYPALSATVRLAKRWLACHMLLGGSSGLTHATVELLCAHLFQRAAPHSPPGSCLQGFHRFLELLSKLSWDEAPFKKALYKERLPSKQIVSQAVAYAKSGHAHLSGLLTHAGEAKDTEFKSLFATSTDLFPVRIHLFPHLVHNRAERVFLSRKERLRNAKAWLEQSDAVSEGTDTKSKKKKKELKPPPSKKQHAEPEEVAVKPMPLSGFSVAHMLLRDLSEVIPADVATFWYDECGGECIYGRWSGQESRSEPFAFCRPVNNSGADEPRFEVNTQEVLHTIRRIGEGVVQSVDIQ